MSQDQLPHPESEQPQSSPTAQPGEAQSGEKESSANPIDAAQINADAVRLDPTGPGYVRADPFTTDRFEADQDDQFEADPFDELEAAPDQRPLIDVTSTQVPSSQSDRSFNSVIQSLQQTWARSLPILKTQSDRILKQAIQTAESVVARLKTLVSQLPTQPKSVDPRSPRKRYIEDVWGSSSASSPPSTSSTLSAEVAERIAALIIKLRPYGEMLRDKGRSLIEKIPLEKIQPLLDKASPALEQARSFLEVALEKSRPVLATIQTKSQPVLDTIQARWRSALPKMRSRLPMALNQQLSDRALTRVAIGLAVVLVWIGSGLLTGNPAATLPSSTVASRSAPPPTFVPIQKPLPAVAPTAALDVVASPLPAVPEPLPNLNLTPHQSLIAAIQDQVAEVTNRYADGLIQATQANFRSGILMVKLGSGWYTLSQGQQDSLTSDMLKRSRELDFRKLEITDPENMLLARSPVVGDKMVVLRRDSL